MNKDEAIKYLNEFIIFKKISNITEEEAVECFKLAVEALQEHQHYKDLAESYEKTINKLTKAIAEQQPCKRTEERTETHACDKKGHWIGHRWVNGKEEEYIVPIENGVVRESCICSECKEWLVGSDEYGCGGRYCPSCGVKMEEKK